jgi:ADP-ribose pyrophosphatase YjhB (NUDIX family)
MEIKKLSGPDYNAIYSKVPRLCIDLIIEKSNEILLIERAIDPGKGLWHLPGGTVLLGETILMAATRIVKEETGLEVKKLEFLGVMEFANPKNSFFHTVSIVHRCTCAEGSVKGSFQGSNLNFISFLPFKMIEEQKLFLSTHLGVRAESAGNTYP